MPLYGFGNHHQSEANLHTLPLQQNSPQHLPQGLIAEQISGSTFSRQRAHNLHSWLYRKYPSVMHSDYQPYKNSLIQPIAQPQFPNPLRWSPFPMAGEPTSFLSGLHHIARTPSAHLFIFEAQPKTETQYLVSYDGEWLFIPYVGKATLHTEFGLLSIQPGEIAVIPRGVFFYLSCDEPTMGYVCENKGFPLALPELGLLGANALANPRHFIYPDAAFEETTKEVTLFCKYQDNLFQSTAKHSPLNVVAWHGNFAPYRYDLMLFNTINTVSFDHPDPSIFTLLSSPSEMPGVSQLDLVVFPPRWLVAQHSFRPPYFHRNIMSELMGLIWGKYDAKQHGFEPGGISIHNSFTPHGPDKESYELGIKDPLIPTYLDNTLAFMLESVHPWQITEYAMQHAVRQKHYSECWL